MTEENLVKKTEEKMVNPLAGKSLVELADILMELTPNKSQKLQMDAMTLGYNGSIKLNKDIYRQELIRSINEYDTQRIYEVR